MKINFLGDSVTAGAGASNTKLCFVERVGELLNCTVKNYGVCGTRIAKQKTPSDEPVYDEDFNKRALNMDKDADYVFVFGGTNDYGHGDAELGDLSEVSEYTFCGALNTLIKYLLKIYKSGQICFILPLNRFNQDNIYGEGNKKTACYPLKDYVNCERRILEGFGLNYLDFGEKFPEPKVNTGDELTVDGLHPNDKGHNIIAKEVCKFIKSNSEKTC